MATTPSFYILLLLSTILLVGVIAFIYSRNWRTALAVTSGTIMITVLIVAITAWRHYLSNHFIGQYDELGIPFQTAGPGWPIFRDTWPLWLIPTCLVSLLIGIAILLLYRIQQPAVTKSTPIIGQSDNAQQLIALQEKTAELEYRVAVLQQEVASKGKEVEELISLNLQQAEELVRLKNSSHS